MGSTEQDVPKLPDEMRRILDTTALAFLATIDPDGGPQVTPVWVNVEDERVAFNTSAGRVKHRNMERDPRVTLALHDPDDQYAWVSIQGTVTMTTEGADEHIDRLAKKYLGKDLYPWRSPSEQRVTVFVEPTRIVTS
jgi:PPOX class probable F420-dependent enzyme